MKVIVITDETLSPAELPVLETLSGMNIWKVHFRKPVASEMVVRRLVEKSSPGLRRKLILHSHYHLVEEFHLAGCYFRWIDIAKGQIPEIQKKNRYVFATGIHELSDMNQLPDWIDYIWVSPVFPSISKPGYQKNWDILHLKEILRSSPVPVFALGGLQEKNIGIAAEMGFQGIALKGILWKDDDPVRKLENILRILNQ